MSDAAHLCGKRPNVTCVTERIDRREDPHTASAVENEFATLKFSLLLREQD